MAHKKVTKRSRTLKVLEWISRTSSCLQGCASSSSSTYSTEPRSDRGATDAPSPPIAAKSPHDSPSATRMNSHHAEPRSTQDAIGCQPLLQVAKSRENSSSAEKRKICENSKAALEATVPACAHAEEGADAPATPGVGEHQSGPITEPTNRRCKGPPQGKEQPLVHPPLRRRCRAERAARSKAHAQAVEVYALLRQRAAIVSGDERASANRAPTFETPVFFVHTPEYATMRIDATRMLALSALYCGADDEDSDNQVSEAEESIERFIRENRRRRHNRVRVNRCRARAAARQARRRRDAAREMDRELINLAERLAGVAEEEPAAAPRRARRARRSRQPVALPAAAGAAHPPAGMSVQLPPVPGAARVPLLEQRHQEAHFPGEGNIVDEFRAEAQARYGAAPSPANFGAVARGSRSDVPTYSSDNVRRYLEIPLRPVSRSEPCKARADSSSPPNLAAEPLINEISNEQLLHAADQIIDRAALFGLGNVPAGPHQRAEERDEGVAMTPENAGSEEDDDFMAEFLQAMDVPRPPLRMVIRRRPEPHSTGNQEHPERYIADEEEQRYVNDSHT
ncbi:hypothetical protein QAD02_001725 [Eretmocerus hayati]|uniref:Uncharacterized protein n=1 Tax=Eretmocerus hayati TaxID=131215 RepID=A0ACC2NIL2_9HYME|nr:hypothetical protein QAD02_001725 [Eretmocerus hayati]